MFSTFIVRSAVLAGAAYAQTTHEVMTDGIAYVPSTLEGVAEGDMVRVTFSTDIPHDILSSTYDDPCTYNSAGGLASEVYNAGEVFVWTVNSTDPAFFFCSVMQHCQGGMILAINPTDTETLEGAVANAEGTSSEGRSEAGVLGGMLESDTSDDSSATPTSAETGASETSTMPEETSAAATDDAEGSAYGMRSSVAMVAAVVGGSIAFAL